ncbi:hypothetical protein HK101_010308, partial [Irineochytrium annulatum]
MGQLMPASMMVPKEERKEVARNEGEEEEVRAREARREARRQRELARELKDKEWPVLGSEKLMEETEKEDSDSARTLVREDRRSKEVGAARSLSKRASESDSSRGKSVHDRMTLKLTRSVLENVSAVPTFVIAYALPLKVDVDVSNTPVFLNPPPDSGIDVSHRLGLHFGRRLLGSAPERRILSVRGPPGSVLRRAIVTNPDIYSARVLSRSASCSSASKPTALSPILESPTSDATREMPGNVTGIDTDVLSSGILPRPLDEADDGIAIEITSTSSAFYGVAGGWLLLDISGARTGARSGFASGRFVVARPLVAMFADKMVGDFSYDVYTRPFVPDGWKALNDAPAAVLPGQAPPDVGWEKYVKTWDPKVWEVPQLEPIFSEKSVVLPPMEPATFGKRISLLLRLEIGHRMKSVASKSLYGVTIGGKPSMYEIVVPGIVDDSPRLSIGDIVRVRKMEFDGYEYEGHIYATQRRSSTIFCKIPNLAVAYPTQLFNVQFLVDDEPPRRAIKAITEVENWVAMTQFGRRIMFPEVEDGILIEGGGPRSVPLDGFIDRALNWAQMVRFVDCGPWFTCFNGVAQWGPPGTGKTKTCIEAIYQVIRRDPHARVLACAPSHSAADTITRRLRDLLIPADLLRLISPRRSFIEVPEQLLPYTFSVDGTFDMPPLEQVLRARVVVCTCEDAAMLAGVGLTNKFTSSAHAGFWREVRKWPYFLAGGAADIQATRAPARHVWTHLLVDEAGQASESETAIPLSVVAAGFKPLEGHQHHHLHHQQPNAPPGLFAPPPRVGVPVILSGDHMQLGPIVQSAFVRQEGGCISMFERLMARQLYRDHPEARRVLTGSSPYPGDSGTRSGGGSLLVEDVAAPFANLVRNYRSHASMLMVPSHLSYCDTLVPFADSAMAGSMVGAPVLPNPAVPIAFVGIEGIDMAVGEEGSWWNPMEAAQVLKIAGEIAAMPGVEMSDFGVIAPFREQVKRLRQLFRAKQLGKIDVGTVEDYQGMERRIIILSCVRSRTRFLDQDVSSGVGIVNFAQRLNVALTRAQSLLVIVGNPRLLAHDPHWVAHLAFYVRNGCYTGSPAPAVVNRAAAMTGRQADALNTDAAGSCSSSDDETTFRPSNSTILMTTSAGGTPRLPAKILSNFGDLEMARDKGRRLMSAPSTMWLGASGGDGLFGEPAGGGGGAGDDDMEVRLAFSHEWIEWMLEMTPEEDCAQEGGA